MPVSITAWAEDAGLREAVRAEMATLIAGHDDGYYAHRLARGLILEPYEEAVLDHVRQAFPPGQARIFEVGAGWGMLCVALASSGYGVTAFNGEALHVSAMRRIVEAASRVAPVVGRNLEIREGFYPYALNRGDLASDGRANVLVSTNTVNEFNPSSQAPIVASAAQFDRFVIDVATFAHDRDERGQAALRALLARGFAERGAVWLDRLVALEPRSDTPAWTGARPPAPDWLFAEPDGTGPVAPQDLAEAWSTIAPHGDRGWTLRLPPALAPLSDAMEVPRRSPFRLTEDGALLGPPHAVHDDIARLGAGRYSHWGEYLYLSTPDGSDPRTNGRHYRLEMSRFGESI